MIFSFLLLCASFIYCTYSQPKCIAENSDGTVWDLTALSGTTLRVVSVTRFSSYELSICQNTIKCSTTPSGFCQTSVSQPLSFNVGSFQSVVGGISDKEKEGATINYKSKEGRFGIVEVICNHSATTPQNIVAGEPISPNSPHYIAFQHETGCKKPNGNNPSGSYCGSVQALDGRINVTVSVQSSSMFKILISTHEGKITCNELVSINRNNPSEITFPNLNQPSDCLNQAFTIYHIPNNAGFKVQYYSSANFISIILASTKFSLLPCQPN